MSFLKKIGHAILNTFKTSGAVLSIPGAAAGGKALITSMFGKGAGDIFDKIVAAVQTTEIVTNAVVDDPNVKTGPQKLQAASALVSQIIQTSESISGHRIKDEALFIKAVQGITSGVADLLNALDGDAIQTQAPGAVPIQPPSPPPAV